MIGIGIDIGSTAAKAAVVDGEGSVAWTCVQPTGFSSVDASERLREALAAAGYDVTAEDVRVVATGYGRVAVPYAHKVVTEITCHGTGAVRLFGDHGTVIDVGGQDTKVIQLKSGRVAKFAMNDKCAAGTGRFLEIMADRLGISQQQMADLARSGEPTKISSMCTVFAESEVISLIGRGEPRENIARGVIESVVSRVATMAGQAAGAPYYLTGGLRGGAVRRATGVAGDHLAPGSLCRSDWRGCPRRRLGLGVYRDMRILNISAQKPDSTGSGTYLAALVREQIETGHRAAVLCGAAPGDTQGELDRRAAVFAVPFESPELPFPICGMSDVMPYPSTRYRDLTPSMLKAFERAFAAAIDRAVAEFRPDLVISHHLYLVTALARECVRGVPVVAVCHSTDLRQLRSHALERDRIVSAVRRLDAVFALHAEQAEQIGLVCGVDADRIHVIGTGYDHRVFCRDASVARRPGSLVYVGKICFKKGVESLVRAVSSPIDDDVRPSGLVLVGGRGDDAEYARIERLTAASDVPVTLAGRLESDELVRAYRSSDVFVLPSFYEGLPLVTIEALACGCKVVATDLPGVRPWMEAMLPGAPVTWVAPPRMTDVDTPEAADLPLFERALADAIAQALAAPPSTFEPSAVSWEACLGRILKVVDLLEGGSYG